MTAAFTPPADEPLTSKEGWFRWVQHDPRPPKLRLDWPHLSPVEQAAYDDARLDYHSDLIVVNTPTIQEVVKTVRRLLIITGGAGTGKTTAITQLGRRAHELSVALRNPMTGPRPVITAAVVTGRAFVDPTSGRGNPFAWIDPDYRRTRLRSDQPAFAPIRHGGAKAGWRRNPFHNPSSAEVRRGLDTKYGCCATTTELRCSDAGI
ncbi:hypothetical protein AB0M79_23710 [Polymorphospora sp. NPDC051019]|uniref:hypothetical protein n=1 Tax=Polymorphospora sp. NPDC051019 TaxID=3155725 RepID=UPI0034422204